MLSEIVIRKSKILESSYFPQHPPFLVVFPYLCRLKNIPHES
jgi:hypothetical protein